jgi:hypothetical protein
MTRRKAKKKPKPPSKKKNYGDGDQIDPEADYGDI